MVARPGKYYDVLRAGPSLKWKRAEGEPEGVLEAILRKHRDGGRTHVLRVEVGTVFPSVVSHEFFEEAYYIEGEMLNTRTNEVIKGGDYVFHKQREKHGPFRCLKPCLILEFRYYG